MNRIVRKFPWIVLALTLLALQPASADPRNPAYDGSPIPPWVPGPTETRVSGYTDHDAWRTLLGNTALTNFEHFANGTLITTQLAADGCISLVSGTFGSPPAPVSQYVTASTSLPFPMFTAGTLPSEPNFLSNDLAPSIYAGGVITFDLTGSTTGIGAYIADGAPLGGFTIEVFDGNTSLGSISVAPRTLPDSFVGIISAVPFNRASFRADVWGDSWGLDNLELACGEPVPASATSWGHIKSLYR